MAHYLKSEFFFQKWVAGCFGVVRIHMSQTVDLYPKYTQSCEWQRHSTVVYTYCSSSSAPTLFLCFLLLCSHDVTISFTASCFPLYCYYSQNTDCSPKNTISVLRETPIAIIIMEAHWCVSISKLTEVAWCNANHY